MQEGSKHLRGVLESLVSEGALTAEQSHLVNTRYEALEGSDSRKSIYAEVAAYLGGAFVLIAMLFLAAKSLGDLPRAARVGAMGALSILLLLISNQLGNRNAMRLRLTSVLSMAGAISATAAVVFVFKSNNGAPWAPFTVGTIIALYSFVRYRHEILHIGAYGYLFITGLLVLGEITKIDPVDNLVFAIYWIVLASIWLYLSWTRLIDQTLGYLIVAATYFLSTQFLFITDHRLISYLIAIIIAPTLGWIYLQDRRWPLLLGAVAITTFTTGEFVATTLGGSLGALLGLLASGIALITSSMLAIRKAQHSQLPLE